MSQPEPFDPDAFDGTDALPASTADGDGVAAPLDEQTARQLWTDAVDSYARVEQHLLRLDEKLSQFVAGRGWLALGYESPGAMIRAESESLVNPDTGRPLSRTSVWRLGRWLTLMDRISVTTGVDAGELDFPSRVLHALPAGRGGAGDRELVDAIADGSQRLADNDAGVITVDHVQSVVDDLLAERGVDITKGRDRTAGHGHETADIDDSDTGVDTERDERHDGPRNPGRPGRGQRSDADATGSDGDADTNAADDETARNTARHYMWIMQQVEALGRAVDALGTITELQDAAAAVDFADAAHDTELRSLRSKFDGIPPMADLVSDVQQAVSNVISAVDEREELGI